MVRESAESTKVWIVYDASAKANEKEPSINDCLETSPPIQNKLWSVLTRNRFHPVALAGDLKQAFLQVQIREEDRDVLRFHRLTDLETKEVETLRFTRALFGLSTSPFLLGGVIDQHLKNLESIYPDEVEEIRKRLYVDDLIGGGNTIKDAAHLKEASQATFGERTFKLHKWPEDSVFTHKLVMHAHVQTLHGGVRLTMLKMRDLYWVTRLRRLSEQVIRSCHSCKRFQLAALPNPATGNLPKEGIEASVPFKFVGVDFAAQSSM